MRVLLRLFMTRLLCGCASPLRETLPREEFVCDAQPKSTLRTTVPYRNASGVLPSLPVDVGLADVEHDIGGLRGAAAVLAAVFAGGHHRGKRHPQIARQRSVQQKLLTAHLFHRAKPLAVEASHAHADAHLVCARTAGLQNLTFGSVAGLAHRE